MHRHDTQPLSRAIVLSLALHGVGALVVIALPMAPSANAARDAREHELTIFVEEPTEPRPVPVDDRSVPDETAPHDDPTPTRTPVRRAADHEAVLPGPIETTPITSESVSTATEIDPEEPQPIEPTPEELERRWRLIAPDAGRGARSRSTARLRIDATRKSTSRSIPGRAA